MLEFFLGVSVFTALIVTLTLIILAVRARLITSNDVKLQINDEKTLTVPVGEKLLNLLAEVKLFLPASCGGRGTCGQCKVLVTKGGGAVLPTETTLLSPQEINRHSRLACQVVVKRDMQVILPEEILGVKKWQCQVRSNHNVSTFIKELVLDLPAGEHMQFKAGGYVMLECPAYDIHFKDFEIDSAYSEEWDRHDMRSIISSNVTPVTRAYSLANYPEENSVLMLNVRIALAPPGAEPNTPPGLVSSYIFSLKAGDTVSVAGPYGHFFARQTENEMIFIGGGAGMAPMRSHILDQLLRIKTKRKISFWYGARNKRELFYKDVFDKLQNDHENFTWQIALSEPLPEDSWQGHKGLVHKVLYEHYLKDHPEPDNCEYYLCGPPMMNAAVISMLAELGVDEENILLDDFGS